jgi:predicted cupin superfamily sugar epimerase
VRGHPTLPGMDDEVSRWVDALGLVPHPEGGFYKETYRSAARVGERSVSTAIYFLITAGNFSALHRIRSDELWHFHSGSALEIETIDPFGIQRTLRLGLDLARHERPQHVVLAGEWFGARLAQESSGPDYALVSCTVAPGFDFADFELADRASLTSRYPQHQALIASLTRS